MEEEKRRDTNKESGYHAHHGLTEVQMAIDGLLIAIGLSFGIEQENGGKKLELEPFNVSDLLERYCLKAERSKEKGYFIFVQKRDGGK